MRTLWPWRWETELMRENRLALSKRASLAEEKSVKYTLSAPPVVDTHPKSGGPSLRLRSNLTTMTIVLTPEQAHSLRSAIDGFLKRRNSKAGRTSRWTARRR